MENFLEEYSPIFLNIKGPDNVIVDVFSQVPVKPFTKGMNKPNGLNKLKSSLTPGNANSFSIEFDYTRFLYFFLNHPLLKQIFFLWAMPGYDSISLKMSSCNRCKTSNLWSIQ
jgi:hypothetical protein